jgi:hypothetical protein
MKRWLPWILTAVGGFFLIWTLEPFGESILESARAGKSELGILRFYPALQLKLKTFGPELLTEFLLQIKFRWLLLVLLAGYLISFFKGGAPFQVSEKSLIWKVRLYFGIQLIYLPDLLKELTARHQWKAFYAPLPIFRELIPSFPPAWVLQFVVIFAFSVSAFFLVSKWKPSDKLPAWIAVAGLVFWTWLLAVFFGFGKIDHTYASLFSANIFLVLWLFYWRSFPEDGYSGFRLFQAGIWGCYFFAGLEKLLLSGWNWIDDQHFQNLCWVHPETVCKWIGSFSVLPQLVLLMAILFQLATAIQWKFPRWGYVNSIGGLLFHLGTWLIFDVGGWQSPWILMLLFLWPLQNKVLSSNH